MRETLFYGVIIVAMVIGWLFFEWIKKIIRPDKSGKHALLFLLAFMAYIILYTGAVVFLVRLIFGKPS